MQKRKVSRKPFVLNKYLEKLPKDVETYLTYKNTLRSFKSKFRNIISLNHIHENGGLGYSHRENTHKYMFQVLTHVSDPYSLPEE